MDLERLNKALSTWEVAEQIFKVDNGKTLSEALMLLEAANDPDPSTIKGAVRICRSKELEELAVDDEKQNWIKNEPAMKNHIRGSGKITLMKNKSGLAFNGKTITRSSPSFNDIVDAPQRAFNKVVDEDRREIPWIKSVYQLNLNEKATDVLKRAVARKQAIDKACREKSANRAVKNVKDRILQRHQIEETITPAARTLKTHQVNEPTVYNQLPKDFSDSRLAGIQRQPNVARAADVESLPALRMPDYADTKAMMPDYWKRNPKITPTVDNSFSAMKTRAAQTLERPKGQEVPNPETNDQGEVADKFYGAGKSRPEAATVKNSGPDSYSETQKRKTREGQWPADPATPWYPEETASSRSPGSRW